MRMRLISSGSGHPRTKAIANRILLQYRSQRLNHLKARPVLEGCRTARLCNPPPLQERFSAPVSCGSLIRSVYPQ